MKVICFLFDPNVGGPTIRARLVYKELLTLGYDARIAIPGQGGTAEHYFTSSGIRCDRLNIAKPTMPNKLFPFLVYILSLPLSIWRTRTYLRREKVDVIHVNGAFDIVPALAAKFSGAPLVWHLNDTVFSQRLSRLLGLMVRGCATHIIVAAERVGQHYGIPPSKRTVIFAPVDVHRFVRRNDSKWKTNSEPMLGLLANWNWIKGQDKFVDVIVRLRQSGIAVRGRIIGRFLDSQRSYWEPILDRIEQQVPEGVIEAVGHTDVPELELQELDVLLLTSRSEASPMCVLEAMSCGVPVVAFDVGGVREMLGDPVNGSAGTVVAAGNTEALANAARDVLLNEELYQACSDVGRKRARDLYSVDCCVARHIEVYNIATNKRA